MCEFYPIVVDSGQTMLANSTRGPRGPWVAHLRKRSKATVEPIIENPGA